MNGWNETDKEVKESVDNSTEKAEAKFRRQQLKLQCLEAAIRIPHKLNAGGANDRMSDKEIVMAAKEFYAFVRT